MRRDGTLILFLILFALLAVVHGAAMRFELYSTYPWFDIPMHFWGGTLIALGSATGLFARVFRRAPRSLFESSVLVLVVGVAWEVFEWYAGIAGVVTYLATIIPDYHTLWVIDTCKDLILDLAGGAVGYAVARSLRSLSGEDI